MLSVILLFASPSIAAANASCYNPDGSLDDKEKFICDPNAAFSACCAPGDMCLTNGLCKGLAGPGHPNDYWRESCTDQSWESDACAKYCYNSTTSSSAAAGNFFVEACGPSTYCCGSIDAWIDGNKFGCCDNPFNLFTAEPGERLSGPTLTTGTFPTTAPTSRSTSHATPALFTTSPTFAANQSSASPSKTNGADSSALSSSAAIGIGVGVGVGGTLVLVGLILGFCFRRRRAKNKQEENSSATSAAVDQPQYATANGATFSASSYEVQRSEMAKKPDGLHELSHEEMLVEAPNEREAVEAPNERRIAELHGE